MINLRRIIEQTDATGQYYDLGKDFSNFKRTFDSSSEKIKQTFEQAIGAKLNGKRIRARASRGYKQYVKDYEFDVVKITLDDYYDNYVVVAHDTSPKPKEYFLKPGFKIQIIGMANGQPSTGNNADNKDQVGQSHPVANNNQMAGQGNSMVQPEAPLKEAEKEVYNAYSVDDISQDIKKWLPEILLKPETNLRDYIAGLGWLKNTSDNATIAMFDLKLPLSDLKAEINSSIIINLLGKANGPVEKYYLKKMELNEQKDTWLIRIKKVK